MTTNNSTEIAVRLPADDDGIAPLWQKYSGQHQPQPAFLEFEPADGTARFGVNGNPGPSYGVPFDVWHGVTRRYSVQPYISRDGLAELAEAASPLLQRIADGYSSRWDGSNFKGRLTDDATEAEEELEALCERISEESRVDIHDAGEWLYGSGSSAETVAESVGVTARSTDAEIEEIATGLIGSAETDGVGLDGDVAALLRHLRDTLEENAAGEEE
jgi:hypothetical protein